MNINQLKYFVEFARIRNFSKTAEHLGISQPALSLQIQKLENEFEYQLIDRTKKPLALTQEGELFFEKALKIVQQIEDLDNLSLEIENQFEGILKVGIIPTLSPYLVPLFINELNKKYPKIFLDITEFKTEEIIAKLNYNELDLGIVSTPLQAKNIGFVPLFYEEFYLYVSDRHDLYHKENISIEGVPLNDLWYLREGNCFQNQVNSICQLPDVDKISNSFRYISYSIESLKRIVEVQGGMTFIPELATMNIPEDYEDMVKSIEPNPIREVSAAYLKTSGLKKLAFLVLDEIVENVPARMRIKTEKNAVDPNLKF